MFSGASLNKVIEKLAADHRKKIQKTTATRRSLLAAGVPRSGSIPTTSDVEEYGPRCQKPDMPDGEFQLRMEKLLNGLAVTQEEKRIERATLRYGGQEQWIYQRRQRLTASNLGRVCKMRSTTSCAATVRHILFGDISKQPAVQHGIRHEPVAIAEYTKVIKLNILNYTFINVRFII